MKHHYTLASIIIENIIAIKHHIFDGDGEYAARRR